MHGARILNRDLKPANVLFDTNGIVKIADFGLSVAFGVPRSDRPWKHKPASYAEGDVCEGACGTPGYMAPEVIRGDKYGYPADIFSLGCVFYELLLGRVSPIPLASFSFSPRLTGYSFPLAATTTWAQLRSVTVRSHSNSPSTMN